MLVLHALWTHPADETGTAKGGLFLWAEDGSRPLQGPASAHPYACPAHALADALERLESPVDAGLGDVVTRTLLLPSTSDGPAPSPLFHPVHAAEPGRPPTHPDRLAAWRVEGLLLEPGEGVEFLVDLPAELPPGLFLSDSARYWAEASKLVLELVAAGRVLPVVESEPQPRSLWRPLAHEPAAAARVRLLRQAMPPVCAAECNDANATYRGPEELLDDMLCCSADAVARRLLAGLSLLPARKGRPSKEPPAAEAWLSTLTRRDPNLRSDGPDAKALAAGLDAWSRPILSAARRGLRTCFRLSAPESDPSDEGGGAAGHGETWRLDFLLASCEDPSLQVTAAQVWKSAWKSAPRGARALARLAEDPQERLLTDLGRAARLHPALEEALRVPEPAGLDLDAAGAYDFLATAVPLLEQAGFGVLVPPWWKTRETRLGLRLRAKPTGASASPAADSEARLGLNELCEFHWEIALGEGTISPEELSRLAKLKVPLVQVRGQWVELAPKDVQTALNYFRKRGQEGSMPVSEIMRVGLGLEATQAGLPVLEVRTEGWLADVFSSDADARLTAMPTPAAFQGQLRPYQERGLSWLHFLGSLGLGACLADDMGLGKTIQLLALLVTERGGVEGAPTPHPTLLICPMSVVGNWQHEAARFAPGLRVLVHHGARRLTGEEFAAAAAESDLVVTTYGLAARDLKTLGPCPWARLVLDEAQHIKNYLSKQSRAVRGLQARQRVALTGTPVENRLSELWSILDFLNPGLLGGPMEFRTRFATPIERFRSEDEAALLKRLTGPFILRRLKTDKRILPDLPDKVETKEYCNLTREQATLYSAVVQDMMTQIETSSGIQRRGLILAALTRLKQICNHPAHFLRDQSGLEGRSGKLARLTELLAEILEAGDKTLIFTQYAEWGGLLAPYLEERLGAEVPYLYGGTPRAARDQLVEKFQSTDGPGVFLLSLKAGGTGLNLTAANHVIHYDRWWNPAVEDQATDRAYRIGQHKNVQVHKLVCQGTLEERIDKIVEEKRALAAAIVGAGEQWLTELSTSQIREIVSLAEDAVVEEVETA